MPATTVRSIAKLVEAFPGLLDLAGGVAARTLTEYRRDLSLYVAFCCTNNHEPRDAQSLRTWRAHMVDHTQLSPNTINRRLAAVKRVIRATSILGEIPIETAHAFAMVEPVKVSLLRSRLRDDIRIPLEPEQVKTIMDLPDTHTLAGLRDRALLATYAGSGCRVSEIVSLQTGDIMASKGGWLLRVLGKGQSTHRKPMARAITAKMAWRVVRKYAAAALAREPTVLRTDSALKPYLFGPDARGISAEMNRLSLDWWHVRGLK